MRAGAALTSAGYSHAGRRGPDDATYLCRPVSVTCGLRQVLSGRNIPMTTNRSRGARLVALAAIVTVAATACSNGGRDKTTADSSGGGANAAGSSGYTIAMITHETPGDTFWDKIKAGAQQAAKDTGVTLKYSNDPDATKQAVLIQNAVDSKVDGIAPTLVTPDALIPNVKKAVAAGIPVDSFNSGLGFYKQAGSLVHFSSDEFLAGQQAGQKIKAAGG